MAQASPLQVIQQWAPRLGLDPAAVVAYALTQGGTSWGAVGDHGTSFGPFQAHIGGAAGNRSPASASAWANSPGGLVQMMQEMARAGAAGRKGPEAAAYIVGPSFGRGANPARDEANARAMYGKASSLVGGAQAPEAAAAPPQQGGVGLGAAMSADPMQAYRATLASSLMQSALKTAQSASGSPDVSGLLQLAQARQQLQAASQVFGPETVGQPVGAMALKVHDETGQAHTNPHAPAMIQEAQKYLGSKYVFGGASPQTGFDCSGFVQYLYGKQGIQIPRTSQEQYHAGRPVSSNNLQPGDVVFFVGSDGTRSAPGHEGLYIGNGQFIQSPHTGDVVKISRLADYGQSYVGARRMA